MKKSSILKIATVILTSNLSLAENLDSVRWIAQDNPPYVYINKDGKNSGSVVEMVGEILKGSESDKTIDDIEIRTLSKLFVRFNDKENTVFFPIAKTAKREGYFKWVGPIFEENPVVFAKTASNITIKSIEDIKAYSIIGIDGYVGLTQIEDADISIKYGNSNRDNMLKLKENNIDLVVCDELVGSDLMKNLNMSENDFHVVYRLDKYEMFFAFNKDTDDAILEQVKQLLDKAKKKEKK